jgi:hypothetical protein
MLSPPNEMRIRLATIRFPTPPPIGSGRAESGAQELPPDLEKLSQFVLEK